MSKHEREELFSWVESHHYKSDLVSVRYRALDDVIFDCWTLTFDTGDVVHVYGYPDDQFALRFNDPVIPDEAAWDLDNCDSIASRIKGIINDEAWYGLITAS